MASRVRGTLYTGVTSNLPARTYQHKSHLIPGFTAKYDVRLLVWYEVHASMEAAILREKKIKEWKRAWKIELVETMNPEWRDLYREIIR